MPQTANQVTWEPLRRAVKGEVRFDAGTLASFAAGLLAVTAAAVRERTGGS